MFAPSIVAWDPLDAVTGGGAPLVAWKRHLFHNWVNALRADFDTVAPIS